MSKESKSMQELHEIRVKNYETTKNMSTEEMIRHIREGANETKKMMRELKVNDGGTI